MPRQALGHYEILAPLGRGGMGEVYRAHDTHLDRDVALKVLTGELARDEALLARFDREAKLLAAVNHPNIAGIHSIEQAEGKRFLVLELVEGQSLSQRLDAGPPTLVETLDICRQVADALAAAHARQIIHRDLKPANVMVTGDGFVKLLDFGVAKALGIEQPGAARTQSGDADTSTTSGMILGTAPYMSPEQVRGKELDARTDIWSFGCLLFEMLSGCRVFERDTVGDTLAAIIEGDVDWDALPPGTPGAVLRVLRRCLNPDPRQRLHNIADARLDLEETLQSLSGAITIPTRRVAAGRRKWGLAAAVAVILVASLWLRGDGWFERLTGAPATDPPGASAVRAVPLTSLVGSETYPALSPDGRFVAFAWNGGDGNARGNFDLYVQQVGSGDPLRLTHGTADVAAPTWAPDAGEIAFLRRGVNQWRVETVPPLGGSVRTVGTVSGVAFPGLDYSPDGEHLAVVHRPGPGASESIFVVNRRTGEKVRLSEPLRAGEGDRHPVFSPDGSALAFVRWHESPLNDIYVFDLSGNAEWLTSHEAYIDGMAWLPDGSGLVFSSALGGTSSLWQVDRRGTSGPLGFGDGASGVSVAPGALVYARRLMDTNLWIVGGPAAPEVAPPRRFIGSTRDEWAPHFSPDGGRIAFMSSRSGAVRVWICNSDGADCSQLPTEGLASTPRWSPDGSYLVFHGESDGGTDVRVIPTTGGTPRVVIPAGSVDLATGWSADSRRLYVMSDRSGEYQIWKVDALSGEALQLTRGGGVMPVGSGDGRFVYYLREDEPLAIWRVAADGGDERLVFEHPGLSLSGFTVWNKSLLYFLQEPGVPISAHILDPETGSTREMFRLPAGVRLGRYGRMTVSPDGLWIVYPQQDGLGSDLMMVRDFAPAARR